MSKRLIIVGVIILIIGACLFIFKDSIFEPKLVYQLNGEANIIHNLNDEYKDLGVTITKGDKDLSGEVSIRNNVDVTKEGKYVVVYQYNDQVLVRNVEVRKVNSFKLIGDENVYILINGKYNDPKVEAIYNENDYSNQVTITNNYDVTKPGDYTITYYFDKLDKTLTRNIHVGDFDDYLTIDYDSKTMSKSIEVKLIMNKDEVSKYTLPDNSINNTNASFTVSKNGEYTFTVYDKYDNNLIKKINITNIINPITATCTATVKDDKTTVKVTTSNEITKYVYNNVESTSNTHTFKKAVTTNKVTLYDKYDQKLKIVCKTDVIETKKLEIHFIASGFYDDAILIKSKQATIFIDGGRGHDQVVKYLQKQGVSKIDYVIGSHTEYDHIDAQADVIARFNVKNVLYPNNINSCGCSCDMTDVGRVKTALKSKNMSAKVQSIPSKLQVGDMTLYFIAPFSITCNKNNNSFVFILKYVNNYFMFTGDADSNLHDVNQLNSNARKAGLSSIKADVIKYPHHGNETLDSRFINAVDPKYFIVPNYNAPQHPTSSFMSDMNKKDIKVYRQSDSKTGNILITSDGNKINFTMNV